MIGFHFMVCLEKKKLMDVDFEKHVRLCGWMPFCDILLRSGFEMFASNRERSNNVLGIFIICLFKIKHKIKLYNYPLIYVAINK